MKIFCATVVVACIVSSPAFAISASYKHKLERSGCAQITEADGTCDINKMKLQNYPHKTPDAGSPSSGGQSSSEKVEADFIAQGHSRLEASVMSDKLWQSVQTNSIRNKQDSCDVIVNETKTTVAQANADCPEKKVQKLAADVGRFAKEACLAAR